MKKKNKTKAFEIRESIQSEFGYTIFEIVGIHSDFTAARITDIPDKGLAEKIAKVVEKTINEWV